jgi:dTDP-4-dehydrorhamnose 3,5-epimerase-like enzyme
LQINETKLDGVWKVTLDKNPDFRGSYKASYVEDDFNKLVPDVKWVEDDVCVSDDRGVFRGIHYSPHCWKYYLCIHGKIEYYIVNCDKSDSEYGKWQNFTLEPYDGLIKHPKYGAGMLALKDNTILFYKQSQYYDANNPDQKTFTLKDFPDIFMPNIPLLLSKRDTQGFYDKETK